MPLTAASGPISNLEQLCATSLSACKAFQTLTGSANAAAALAHIYFDSLTPPDDSDEYTLAELQTLRPFAVVWTHPDEGFRWQQDARGAAGSQFKTGGTIIIQLEKDIASGDLASAQEYMRKWKNELGAIVQSQDENNPGLCELAGSYGYLDVRGVTLHGPSRSDEEEREALGDYLSASLEVRWGRV